MFLPPPRACRQDLQQKAQLYSNEPDEAQYSSLNHALKASCYQTDAGDQYDAIACSNSETTEKAAPEPTYSTLETTQPPHGGEQPHDTQAQQQENTSIGAYNIIRSENMQDMNQKKKEPQLQHHHSTAENLTANMSKIELANTCSSQR